MGSKRHHNKKQKKYHYLSDKEGNVSDTQDQSETGPSASSETTEIPGFYYDPVKNKYFKIQPNAFRVQNVPTEETIKKKIDQQKLENECRKQLLKRNNFVDYMIQKEMYGTDNFLRLDFTDNLIIKSRLKELTSFEPNSTIKKIEVLSSSLFSDGKNFLYFLANFVGVPFYYSIFKICTESFKKNENLTKSQLLKKLIFVDQSNSGIITGPIGQKQSNLPAFMTSKNHIVSTFQSLDHNDNKPYKLKISQISTYDSESEFLIQIPEYFKNYTYPLWCSNVNKEMTRCAVGLHQGGEVNNLHDNQFYRLNTYRSDVFCIQFKPESDQVFTGCKSKHLFGYDLRSKVNNPICEMEHGSCVNDLIFCPKNSNYLFVSDFTGEVNLWDVRYSKNSAAKFSTSQQCNSRCSIKLDNSGDYLYTMAKDGHIRVFNTISKKLIKTIISPEQKEPNQLYSEIPSIHVFDDLSMLYGVDKKLMYYSI
ncbi:DDB1- and CUL4-associated factor 4 isoform X1 [Brachionus plicatilis]|uniref:DDB1-and CUL4-associated factor 4 isoform X1 n=1 Tax=Brachionus plicatilis TaxID=10195 RepID=A0A3M7RF39_BRAPC|nr:DDB1- and CUL4-associated factor 4 isoform X1 [Brachionus plicatilis]